MSKKSLEMHADFDAGVCVCDNLQMKISIKFQRFGHSSNLCLAATRLFVKPTRPKCLSNVPTR